MRALGTTLLAATMVAVTACASGPTFASREALVADLCAYTMESGAGLPPAAVGRLDALHMLGKVDGALYAPVRQELEAMWDSTDTGGEAARAFNAFCNGQSVDLPAKESTVNDTVSAEERRWLELWNASSSMFRQAQCDQWRSDPDGYSSGGAAAGGFRPDLVARLMTQNC